MEERKRPVSHDHNDSGPPTKKQAISMNGTSKSHVDVDMPWQDDLEASPPITHASSCCRFQKEAIWRQMQEFKRERNQIENRLTEMTKRAEHHDEHLMVIDAWFSELLDEIRVQVGDVKSHSPFRPFPTALLASESPAFKTHLQSRSSEISSAVSALFGRAPSFSPEITDLQGRITKLLAIEKAHIVEIERSRTEKERLEGRLEDAALRYMLAEKKLDRSKSATVAKLEKQAISGGRSDVGSGLGGDASNGNLDSNKASGEELMEVELARKHAVAESAKRKEQLESLEAENEKLTIQVTSMTTRLSHLSDDDYSKTDLFQHLKSQHEDVIKRINDLEAVNVQLREEGEKLQAERTVYRVQLEKENELALAAKEAQLAQAENDLARIRAGRDELSIDVSMRKAAQAQERTSIDHAKKLSIAKEERIKALESENERLSLQVARSSEPGSPPSRDVPSPEGMQSQYAKLEKQHALLNTELESLGSAFKKTSVLASQKISNLSALEEKVLRLSAEKTKADQKFFATMKVKEAREQEVRSLRAQNSKSSEMISQLKESEMANRTLQVNLEKQIAEAKESLLTIDAKLRTSQQQLLERTILSEGVQTQVEELKKTLIARDASASATSVAHRTAEVDIETLKVRLAETKRSLDSWKTKGLGNQSGEYEMLRTLAICTVCRVNFKDTTLKTCGHVFCKVCVEERTTSRSRKCPNCGKAFGTGDVMRITL